jgi:hypothetical protein
MAPERMPKPQWWSVLRAVVAGLVLVATLVPAEAQMYERRSRPAQPEFFNPFKMFSPLFRRQPAYEPREIRRAPPQSAEPRAPAAASVDSSKAPPPRKSDTTPAQTVVVMGSSLADWLAYGLEDAYADRPEIGVVRKIHPYSGLVRYDSHSNSDWAQASRDILKDQKADVVVMLIGLMDRQTIRPKAPTTASGKTPATDAGKTPAAKPSSASFEYHSDEWAAAYSQRIDETIAALKSKGVPVIWVGLPSIRGTKSTSDMIYLNDLFRARAEHANIVYVDVWDGFADESGRFATYGPDVEGQVRRLRTGDGVYFTKAGARKLAHYVEREINRVIGTKLPVVATPGGDDASKPAAALPGVPARPVAGPVLSLTTAANATTLAGGDGRSGVADPLAQRVLRKGETVIGPSGRADNFFLTPEAAAASAAAAATAAAPPPATAPKTAAAPATPPAAAKPSAPSSLTSVAKQQNPDTAIMQEEGSAPQQLELDGGPNTADAKAKADAKPNAKPKSESKPKPEVASRESAPPPAAAHRSPPEQRRTPPRATVQKPRPNNARDPRTAARRPPPSRPPVFDPLGLFR